jgi:hypothetical protein
MMTWYPDLGTETMVTEGPHVRAVGWLSSAHDFPTSDVPLEVLERVRELCQRWQDCLEPLSFGRFRGLHTCELCHYFKAYGNIGVPAGDLLYVAPEMLAHYIEAHRYAPPAEFVAALLASPLPGTPEYHDAVARFRELERARDRDRGFEL